MRGISGLQKPQKASKTDKFKSSKQDSRILDPRALPFCAAREWLPGIHRNHIETLRGRGGCAFMSLRSKDVSNRSKGGVQEGIGSDISSTNYGSEQRPTRAKAHG